MLFWYPVALLNLFLGPGVLWYILWDFVGRRLYNLPMKCFSVFFISICRSWVFCCLFHNFQSRREQGGSPASFTIFRVNLSIPQHLQCCLQVFHRWSFLGGESLSIPNFQGSYPEYRVCQKTFLCLQRWWHSFCSPVCWCGSLHLPLNR